MFNIFRITLVWINDQPNNKVAKETIEVALTKPPNGVTLTNYEIIETDQTNMDLAKEEFCNKYNAMIDNETPPDLVLDSTRSGAISKVVKMMSKKLGLPTLSMSYGQMEDIIGQ